MPELGLQPTGFDPGIGDSDFAAWSQHSGYLARRGVLVREGAEGALAYDGVEAV